MKLSKITSTLAMTLALAACGQPSNQVTDDPSIAEATWSSSGTAGSSKPVAPAGAAFTTFDAVQGGCLDSPNGINCNNYSTKGDVYMNGGPVANGLSDGTYFFAVLVPGYQNGGFAESADGNLSDTHAGVTLHDLGGGDGITNRTFTVTNHVITSYLGTHHMGQSPDGKAIIKLFPYDDTSNSGGVYKLAICQTGATSPSQCKFDSFRVQSGTPIVVDNLGTISGLKYYDANANGQMDPGEVTIPGWLIKVQDGVSLQTFTDGSGAFEFTLPADIYTVSEAQGGGTWMQTGNLVSQFSVSGGSSAQLNADKTYTVGVVNGSSTTNVLFGNLCIGAAPNNGGHTLGFWSNKNGSAIMAAGDNYVSVFSFLSGLNLRNADGTNFDPSSYSQFRTWLLSASATNMAYMLSAQLTAMELNVRYNFVSGTALIYAPGTASANSNGFATVQAVMDESNASLGANGFTVNSGSVRTLQEALKNALDKGNNNLNFVQPGPDSCPDPTLVF